MRCPSQARCPISRVLFCSVFLCQVLALIHKSFLLTLSVMVCPGECRTNPSRFLITFSPNCSQQRPSHRSPERTLAWTRFGREGSMSPSPVPIKAAFVRQRENQGTGLWQWQGCHQPLQNIFQWPPVSS